MEKKNKSRIAINLMHPIVLSIIVVLFPLLTGLIEVRAIFKLLILINSLYFVSVSIQNKFIKNYEDHGLLPLLGPYILLILLYPLLLIQFEYLGLIIITFMALVGIIWLIKCGTFVIKIQNQLISIMAATILTIAVFYNLSEALSAHPIVYDNYFQDFYWFTAMTASIKEAVFNHAIYEEGTGIYHHILGLFPAATISRITGLNTHIALWSVSMPLAILCAFVAPTLVINETLKQKANSIPLFFGLLSIILLFPINPNYLIKGDFLNMVWFGPGNTLPVLPTWAAVYIFSALSILLLQKTTSINFKKMMFPYMLLSLLLIWSKITSFAMFWGMSFCFLMFYEKKLFSHKQKLLLLSIIPALFLIITYYSNSSAKFIFEPGYIVEQFLIIKEITSFNILKAFVIGFVTIIIWSNLRLFLIFNSNSKLFSALNFSLLIGLVSSLVFMALLKIKSFNIDGLVMEESSLDLLQFLRSVFIYAGLGFALFFIMLNEKKVQTKFISVKYFNFIFLFWISTIFFISVKAQHVKINSTITRDWDKEAPNELKEYPLIKKAMISDYEYSGQFLSAFDIKNWYCTIENRNGGYTYSYTNIDRYKRLESFIKGDISINYIKELKDNDVKILVATPNTLNEFNKLSKQNILIQIKNTKWLYTYEGTGI